MGVSGCEFGEDSLERRPFDRQGTGMEMVSPEQLEVPLPLSVCKPCFSMKIRSLPLLVTVAVLLWGPTATDAARVRVHHNPGLHRAEVRQNGEVFQVATDVRVQVPGNKHATLADLKAGERVQVAYLSSGNARVAHRIKVIVPHPPKANAEKKQHSETAHTGPQYQHASGILRSIDPARGMIALSATPQARLARR